MLKNLQYFSEKAAYFFLILFVVLLPYEMLYSTICIYPLILFSLIALKKEKLKRIPKQVWVFMIIFLLNVVGYVYTTDTWRAGYLLERQLTIFLFPILIPIAIDIEDKKVNQILYFFSFACTLAISFLFFKAFSDAQAAHLTINDISNPRFYNHQLSKPIGIHATYLSLYCSLCIAFLLHNLTRFNLLLKMLLFLGIGILSIGLFFLASRNTIIISIVAILLVYPFFGLRHKAWYFIFVSMAVIIVFMVGKHTNYINERFSKDLIEDIHPNGHFTPENPEPRIMRWQCAWELIKKRPIFGYGSGDEIVVLKESYLKNEMMVSYSEEFNTHNQYLSIIIKNGLVGLLLFLTMLMYFFYLAIKANDFIYLYFLLVLSVGFLTENIIDANKGIFYFAFFNTLLGYQALKIIKNKKSAPSNS